MRQTDFYCLTYFYGTKINSIYLLHASIYFCTKPFIFCTLSSHPFHRSQPLLPIMLLFLHPRKLPPQPGLPEVGAVLVRQHLQPEHGPRRPQQRGPRLRAEVLRGVSRHQRDGRRAHHPRGRHPADRVVPQVQVPAAEDRHRHARQIRLRRRE